MLLSKIRFWLQCYKARKVNNANPLPGKYDRIYHFHIRKSAGTSINAAFWKLAGKTLQEVGRSSLIITQNHIFVRHHRVLINQGNYLYANSHAPFWELNLQPNTFTFSIFRDPVERLYSLYRYYHFNVFHPDAILLDPMHESVSRYKKWLGNSFSDFLDLLPRKHLENQLYMFSKDFNIEEAFTNVQKLSKFYFQNSLSELVADIETISGISINISRERSFPYLIGEINSAERDLALNKLKDELAFYQQLKFIAGSKEVE